MIQGIINKSPLIIPKGWGEEILLHNADGYCGKVLRFRKNGRSSLHYHVKKTETWFVSRGLFGLTRVDPATAQLTRVPIGPGTTVHIPAGQPHQLACYDDCGEIFEASTEDARSDSYRISPGDSQKSTPGAPSASSVRR
jgi:mannose-6-phosphate isomerase-like protein (cupin superfamily)